VNGDQTLFVRGRLLRLVIILGFLALVINLFTMQVVDHREYRAKALQNRQERFRVRAPRGRITDRFGTILADNKYIADITLPRSVMQATSPDSNLVRLMNWFQLDSDETMERLGRQYRNRRGRLVLVPNASLAQISAVAERSSQLPGVRVESRPRRRYLNGPLLAHILGYVGEVEAADLDTHQTRSGRDGLDYRMGDTKGKQGVESTFEEILRGRNGWKLEEVNAQGQIVGRETVWETPVIPGQDVALTISLPLQEAMADALGNRTGCGVAISTRTGQVLAAYSNPSFDPNLLTVSISPEDWSALANDPAKPFFNRAVQATYPPGSLYKPVTSLAALSLDLVDTNTYLEPCLGGWQFGDRFFRCWKHSGHGEVNHTDAMVHSCDTYYYQLGLSMDIDQLAAAARALGLGKRCTSIFPEESPGLIPDRAWYDNRFGKGGWTRGVLMNNAIGQGEILTTPIQMALLSARLASEGRVPDPMFVLSPAEIIRRPDPLPFAASDLQWCNRALRQVVSRGTGSAAALDSIPVAGKTGTAQNPHGEDHAWFMCFAPARNPEVAIAVIVENAGSGSTEAAPVAGQWLDVYFSQSEDTISTSDRFPSSSQIGGGQ
jgi:penicillin-binding protein 2